LIRVLYLVAATPYQEEPMSIALAVLVHNSDHLRRGGDSVTGGVFWLGRAAIVVEVAVVAMVFGRHPAASVAAITAGVSLAAGYVIVHFTPEWGPISDSFVEGDARWTSVFAAVLETAAALGLGMAGIDRLRRRGLAGTTRHVGIAPLTGALRHPLVLAFLVANVIIFVGSLATR
jgi:hypothetical protein